ncbi:MAG: PRC-barrel domain-containing protein [Nanoarchaeota archaeon]|nr:PRC-barrel domain-containing protein [Nanoarchaeota archaeon]MBU1854796.1 PRC-barrel domain-containing protein [Nanoarchaeota archaeon]
MSFKNLEILSSTNNKLVNSKPASDYVDKKVYSNLGTEVGKVKDVVLKNHQVIGYIVKGSKKMFIDKEYIKSESGNVLMLSIYPVISLIGKQVFDSEGRRIGKVVRVERKTTTNNFTNLIVKNKIYSKSISVPKTDVSAYKENIILNKSYEKK